MAGREVADEGEWKGGAGTWRDRENLSTSGSLSNARNGQGWSWPKLEASRLLQD